MLLYINFHQSMSVLSVTVMGTTEHNVIPVHWKEADAFNLRKNPQSLLLFDFVPATVPGCVGQKFAKEFKVLTGTYKTELFHRTVCHDRGRLKRPIQPTQLQHRDRDTQSEPEYRPIFTISSLWNQKETWGSLNSACSFAPIWSLECQNIRLPPRMIIFVRISIIVDF